MKRENKQIRPSTLPGSAAMRRTWDLLTDGMNEVVLKWDGNGRLIYAGKSIEYYTGTERENFYGKNPDQFDALTGCPAVWRSALSQCAITGKSTFITKTYESPRLGKLVFETEVSPDFCEDRIIQGFTAFSRDITDKIAERTRLKRFSNRYDLIIELSKKFAQSPPDQLKKLINSALEKFGNLLDADRAYIFSYDMSAETCSNTYEWCRSGIEPQIAFLQNTPMRNYPEFLRCHIDGKPYAVRETANLNPHTEMSKLFRSQGIKTLITVPIMNENRCIGFAGLDYVQKSKPINQEEIDMLELFSGLLLLAELRCKIANHPICDLSIGNP